MSLQVTLSQGCYNFIANFYMGVVNDWTSDPLIGLSVLVLFTLLAATGIAADISLTSSAFI